MRLFKPKYDIKEDSLLENISLVEAHYNYNRNVILVASSDTLKAISDDYSYNTKTNRNGVVGLLYGYKVYEDNNLPLGEVKGFIEVF